MPRIRYENWNPGIEARRDVRRAIAICEQYAEQGYSLTLRQLYYRYVANGWIPNSDKSYNRLGDIISKARMAGLLDWDYIVDRTRSLRSTSHWDTPGDVIASAAASFRMDKWADQPRRVEVWVEKDALVDVVGRAAGALDVPYFSCRGYVSQSEQWAAARRILGHLMNGQAVTVLHLGDHDPSGIDMTRDITDRLLNFITQDWLNTFGAQAWPDQETVKVSEILSHIGERVNDAFAPIEVQRIALNWDQVERYDPPPNPAKLSDSRSGKYIREYGHQSWELDALPPEVLNQLVTDHISALCDEERYAAIEAQERRHREMLATTSDRWQDVAAFVEHIGGA